MNELEQLQAQIAEMQKKAEHLAAQKKAAVLADMRSKIVAYGITAKDLGFAGGSSGKAPVAAKYQQGENTWSGRCPRPKFINEYTTNGGKLEDLLIHK